LAGGGVSTVRDPSAVGTGDGPVPAGPDLGRPSDPLPPTPVRSTAWGLVRLGLAVAAFVAVFLLLDLGPLLVVIVAVVVMVMVHELGHFATAKWSHMKVTEYFVGFGPRLWSIRRGETEYGVKAIPAGGYVKIPGMTNMEELDPADEPRTYRRQPFHKRILVASAGSCMHFLMAFLLAYGALLYFGAPTAVREPIAGFLHWSGATQTAAQAAGLRKGDVVVGVNGKALTAVTEVKDVVNRSADKPVRLTIDRDGRTRTVTVTPVAGHYTADTKEVLGPGRGGKTVGLIGFEAGTPKSVFTSEGPIRGLGTAVIDIGRDTALTVRSVPHAIANLYSSLASSRAADSSARSGDRPESIVGAVRTATQAEQSGILYLIEILIALNIAFGLLNMLPMLPLDGGHVAIAVYERIRTRRGRPYYQADAAKLLPVVYAFSAVLLVVVVSALYLDIVHPVANPFH
jgi:membrane-associated protease RseP (regulator of RpoE activity)